jgi:cysteine-rich repeat protein
MLHRLHPNSSGPAVAATLALAALLLPVAAGAVTFDWVYVGDPGNPPDTASNCLNDAPDCGSVAYSYYISKYEVTNAQYAEFLNAVADTDTYGLYSMGMAADARGGITRSGSSGSYRYAVKSSHANNPVVFVNWYDAARFANWLHNGQPTGAQGAGTTETGAYTLTGATSISGGRQAGALTFLPTENEWYKAAYYHASSESFFDYPTGSNTAPSSDVPPGASASANFYEGPYPTAGTYALTGSASYDNSFNYLTDVGAYGFSSSPYGIFDQGGNVWEWNETASASYRGLRGGSWWSVTNTLASSFPTYDSPTNENYGSGFRVASPIPVCGDSTVSPNEECDDGNTVSGDGCSSTCTLEICGNGRIDFGEQCDDGNTLSGDGCSPTCHLEVCGNQILDPGEACDDGNLASGDGCDSNCTETACGNGIVTTGEQCDDGNEIAGDGCEPDCTETSCGNGTLTPPEQCDDGNLLSGDGCDSNCTLTACGNGIQTAGEACDDGNALSGDGCDANCTPTACGNAIQTLGEECDDGNLVSGDGCDANCTISACGNGITAGSEECDDGNLTSGDGCDQNCTKTRCGNGVVAGQEECDDGNFRNGDGCSSVCRLEICGNSIVDGHDQCDDGNTFAGDGCSPSCTLEVCGSGVVDPGEECDDGNLVSGDGCDSNCTFTACGNGVLTHGEVCDDGNLIPADGCGIDCQIDLGAQSRAQRTCINEANRSTFQIARSQSENDLACLKAAAKGRLGSDSDLPADFDSCLSADIRGKVAKAQGKLDRVGFKSCFVNEQPKLAILDPVAAREAASQLWIDTTRSIFGFPAEAVPASNRPAARCQMTVAQESRRLLNSTWKVILKAKRASLRGKSGAPARNSEEVSNAIATDLAVAIPAATQRLIVKVLGACNNVPHLDLVFAGCEPSNALELAGCAARAAACNACRLLQTADPLLQLDCDLLDDGVQNASCY